jgi:ATP-dependent 26S proteasome regulatory subunit
MAALCEKLDILDAASRLVVIGATSRTDAVDPSLVAPGRLDHLVEVRLPDAAAQEQVIGLARSHAERNAGRPLVGEIDFRLLLPPMGGMSGGEIRDIFRRALEEKVHAEGQGQDAGLVTTQDLLRQVDVYRRIRAVVEKIRYGQYL